MAYILFVLGVVLMVLKAIGITALANVSWMTCILIAFGLPALFFVIGLFFLIVAAALNG